MKIRSAFCALILTNEPTAPRDSNQAQANTLNRNTAAGVPWVVALDEAGGADQGVPPDSVDSTHDNRRGGVIWAHVLAGGAGCETYFGYAVSDSGDLTSQNWRRYDIWWDQNRYALDFFKSNAIPFWNMTNRNSLLTGAASGGPYCFATNGQVYVAYFAGAATPSLNLSGVTGDFTVRWFDPYLGGGLQTGSVTQVTGGGTVSLGNAPAVITKDRVVLVKLIPPADTTPPSVSITAPTNGASLFANLPLAVSATVTDNVAVAFAELWVDGSLQTPVKTNAPFDFSVPNLALGGHTVAVIGQATSANRATISVSITLLAPARPQITLSLTGGVPQLSWNAPGFLLQSAGLVTGPWVDMTPQPPSPYTIYGTNPQTFYRLNWTVP